MMQVTSQTPLSMSIKSSGNLWRLPTVRSAAGMLALRDIWRHVCFSGEFCFQVSISVLSWCWTSSGTSASSFPPTAASFGLSNSRGRIKKRASEENNKEVLRLIPFLSLKKKRYADGNNETTVSKINKTSPESKRDASCHAKCEAN